MIRARRPVFCGSAVEGHLPVDEIIIRVGAPQSRIGAFDFPESARHERYQVQFRKILTLFHELSIILMKVCYHSASCKFGSLESTCSQRGIQVRDRYHNRNFLGRG